MTSLNETQDKIVKDTEGAVVVLAGAGSGKTRVLTHRIAYILEQKLAYPSEILAITFTNKASKEMKDRIVSMGYPAGEIWASTFHSFCAKILRMEAHNIDGYTRSFSIYDENDKKSVIKKIVKDKNLKEDEYVSLIANMLSDMKNHNLTITEYCRLNMGYRNIDMISNIMITYEQVLKNNNAFDFDDLLCKTLNLYKEKKEILDYYSNKFKYILVDEFQDTNDVQYELVKALSSKHNNIFVVGDEDQNIYSWRGASAQNIKRFLDDYQSVKLYKLEQNYRSTKNIIECANKIIKHNYNRIDKTLWTENDSGARVEYLSKYNETEEAENVANLIFTLTHSFNYQYKDIAILTRLNALSRSFEDKLLSYNIPYVVFGGLKFYDRMEIKNILAYLKLLVNSRDDESFLRIINFPKRGIGDGAIEELKHYAGSYNLLNAIYSLDENCDKKLSKFLGFKNLMMDFKAKQKELDLTEFVEYVVDKLDLKNLYNTDKEEDQNRILNINELILAVSQFEETNVNNSLEDYLQSVSLTTDLDTYNADDNNVTLATVHSAKGLEFKVVFVVGLEEGYFPIQRRDTTDSDIEEERRLMYVAVTRAMERLYITSASSRFLYGIRKPSVPSRFLKELGLVQERPLFNEHSQNYENKSHLSSLSSLNNVNNLKKSNLKQNNQDFNIGDKVKHSKFGIGTITQLDNNTDMIVIEFEGLGRKIFSVKFAPIEKVDN